MNNGAARLDAPSNQASESLPGVAIRCGCSAGDEYGYRARWATKRGDITNAPIACTSGTILKPLHL